MVRYVNREPLTDVYAMVRWPCVRSEVSPLQRSGTLIAIWAKLHKSSWCAETLIDLRGSGDRALKGDRSLIDLIMKLKLNCPEIQEYLHVSQYDSLIIISRMRLATLPFWRWSGNCPILSWVKHLTRSGMRHLFFETYRFSVRLGVPSICVTESGVPNS
jgi:hypothetical protein